MAIAPFVSQKLKGSGLKLLPLNDALDSHRGGVHLCRDRPQAQSLFVELPYRFQLRAQDFPFPPEVIRLALAPKPSDRRCRGALTSPNALLLGNGGQDRQHCITEQPARVQILLGERTPFDAGGRQPFEMVQCGLHASRDSLSRDQNRTKSNLRCRASSNMCWKCGRFEVPPVSWSTYSPATSQPCFAQYSRRAIN